MASINQELHAILLEVVNDLEQTTAIVNHLLLEMNALSPKAAADRRDAFALAVRGNAAAYERLRFRLSALASE